MLLLGGLTIAFKALGPFLVGSRPPSDPQVSVFSQIAPAVFAALIATQVFACGRSLTFDARAAGLAVAILGAQRRAAPLVVLVAAATVTAVIRHLT